MAGSKPTVQELVDSQREVWQAYKRLFATQDGQLVLKDLERRFVNRTSVHVPRESGVVDPNRTLVNEGARECVLYINQQINKAANK